MSQRKRGKVPDYWWDFTTDTLEIVVETDDPRVPGGVVTRCREVDDAERIVDDLKAGRRNPTGGDPHEG